MCVSLSCVALTEHREFTYCLTFGPAYVCEIWTLLIKHTWSLDLHLYNTSSLLPPQMTLQHLTYFQHFTQRHTHLYGNGRDCNLWYNLLIMRDTVQTKNVFVKQELFLTICSLFLAKFMWWTTLWQTREMRHRQNSSTAMEPSQRFLNLAPVVYTLGTRCFLSSFQVSGTALVKQRQLWSKQPGSHCPT